MTDLVNLSTWVGNSHVNRVKFGGTPFGTIPSEASNEERVETRRRAPKDKSLWWRYSPDYNASAAMVTWSSKKIRWRENRAGSTPARRTISNPNIPIGSVRNSYEMHTWSPRSSKRRAWYNSSWVGVMTYQISAINLSSEPWKGAKGI